MLGENTLCTSSYDRLNTTFEDNIVHFASNDTAHAANTSKLDGCPGGGADGITIAPPAEDAAIWVGKNTGGPKTNIIIKAIKTRVL